MKFYICDPSKNGECKKTSCQHYCFRTTKKDNRATGLTWVKHKIADIRTWRAIMKGDE